MPATLVSTVALRGPAIGIDRQEWPPEDGGASVEVPCQRQQEGLLRSSAPFQAPSNYRSGINFSVSSLRPKPHQHDLLFGRHYLIIMPLKHPKEPEIKGSRSQETFNRQPLYVARAGAGWGHPTSDRCGQRQRPHCGAARCSFYSAPTSRGKSRQPFAPQFLARHLLPGLRDVAKLLSMALVILLIASSCEAAGELCVLSTLMTCSGRAACLPSGTLCKVAAVQQSDGPGLFSIKLGFLSHA